MGRGLKSGQGSVGSMLCYKCNYELYAVDSTDKSPRLPYLGGLTRVSLGVHVLIPHRSIRAIR
jgi:hypothetical protein